MTAPESAGRVYGCLHCPKREMTIGESFEHAAEFHPGTTTTKSATPEQLSAGLAEMARLRAVVKRLPKRV